MSEERFIDLETRLTHQDRLLSELNDIVTAQQAKILQLDELCRSLISRVRSMGDAMPARDPGDQEPPHY
jgi:SlyX protein